MSHLRRTFAARPYAALVTVFALCATAFITGAPGAARAQTSPAPGAAQLTGMRAWPSPSGNRLVLEFSEAVTPVAPDSGSGPQLVVAVPIPGMTAAAGVPAALSVGDSAITRVESIFDERGVRFWVRLAPGATFRVYTLAATEDER